MSAVEASPIAGSPIHYSEELIRKIDKIARMTGKVEGIANIYLENTKYFLSDVVKLRHIVFALRSHSNSSLARLERLTIAFEEKPDLKETYPHKYFEAFKKMILPFIQDSSLSRLEYIYIENALNTILESIGALPVDCDPTHEKVRRCWIAGVSQFSSIKESFDTRQLQLSRELHSLVMQKVETFHVRIQPRLLEPLSPSPFDSKLPDFSSCAIIDRSPMPDDYLREDLSLGLFPLIVNIGTVQSILKHMSEHQILASMSLQFENSTLIFALQQRKQIEEKLSEIERLPREGANTFLAMQVASFRNKLDEISSSAVVEYFTKEVLLHTLDKQAALLRQVIIEKCSLKQLLDVPKAEFDRAEIKVSTAWGDYSQALSDVKEYEEDVSSDILLRHRELVCLDKDDIYIHVDRLQERLQDLITRKNGLIEIHASSEAVAPLTAQIGQVGLVYHISFYQLMKELKNRLQDPYSEEVLTRHQWILDHGV